MLHAFRHKHSHHCIAASSVVWLLLLCISHEALAAAAKGPPPDPVRQSQLIQDHEKLYLELLGKGKGG